MLVYVLSVTIINVDKCVKNRKIQFIIYNLGSTHG